MEVKAVELIMVMEMIQPLLEIANVLFTVKLLKILLNNPKKISNKL
jgi:hypothetical protein